MSRDARLLRKAQVMGELAQALNSPGKLTPHLFRDIFNSVFTELEINAQTGTAYTLALSDLYKLVTMTNGSANTVTVPAEATVPFQVGDSIDVAMMGAGVTTIAPAAGVTLRSAGDLTDISAQYAVVSLVKVAADEWLLVGSLA